jgi:hypothetical protein
MKKLLTDCKKLNPTNFEISSSCTCDISAQTSLTNKTLFAPSIFWLNFTSNTEVLNQMLIRYTLDTTLGFVKSINQLKSNQYEKKQELKLLQFASEGFLLKKQIDLYKRLSIPVLFMDNILFKPITTLKVQFIDSSIIKCI